MLIFILFLTLFQGISIYLMSATIAKTKLNHTHINNIFLEISPYNLLDNYIPSQIFDNMIISTISRWLLFITGCTGILICVIIHDIYYKLNNQSIHNNLSECINTTSKLDNTETDIFTNINLIVDTNISQNLDINKLINYLIKNNISCNTISFVNIKIDNDINVRPLASKIYYITSNNIDNAIFEFSLNHLSEYQIICLCQDNETCTNSIFKHLCVSIKNEILNLDYESITNKIISFIK